jgi:hypothetical protein
MNMQSESARMTTAHEAAYRIQYPNSKPRSVKIIALDTASARMLVDVAREHWNGAAFFTSLSFSADGSPGDAQGTTLHAWLGDLAGRTMELVGEVATSDFVVVIASAGSDARSVSIIADACTAHNKSLLALVVPAKSTSDADIAKSLGHLRPFAKMLVVASDADYIIAMLTALRA